MEEEIIIGDNSKQAPKYKISLRGGFSDRQGIKPENTTIQLNEFDMRTRIQMINLITDFLYRDCMQMSDKLNELIEMTLSEVYQFELDRSCSIGIYNFIPILSDTIKNDDYDSVLTLIEYLCRWITSWFCPIENVFKRFNQLFEKEYVGYRFINGLIAPVSDQIEIKEIEEVLCNAADEIKAHLQKALEMLSDRASPDYENSIKESISAVEAECNLLIGGKTTLNKALVQLVQEGMTIHPALKDAFIKLYAYTGDGKGIRHAGDLDGANATFAEAKFMLVACSAFINYLKISVTD